MPNAVHYLLLAIDRKAVAKSDETYIAKAKLNEAFAKLSKYINFTGVEKTQRQLQEIVVQQETEKKSRKELDKIHQQIDALQSELGRLISILDMTKGGPKRPTAKAKETGKAAVKKLEKTEYAVEK